MICPQECWSLWRLIQYIFWYLNILAFVLQIVLVNPLLNFFIIQIFRSAYKTCFNGHWYTYSSASYVDYSCCTCMSCKYNLYLVFVLVLISTLFLIFFSWNKWTYIRLSLNIFTSYTASISYGRDWCINWYSYTYICIFRFILRVINSKWYNVMYPRWVLENTF